MNSHNNWNKSVFFIHLYCKKIWAYVVKNVRNLYEKRNFGRKAQKFYFLFFFLGLTITIILRPSIFGNDSAAPYSSSSLRNLRSNNSPLSLKTMVRPLKKTYAFTLAPSPKNFFAWRSLNSKSCSSVFGPKRISLITVLLVFALSSFSFFFFWYRNFW